MTSQGGDIGGRAHLHTLRLAELASISALLPAKDQRVLEIGGGDGFQAAELARRYDLVVAVDVSNAGRAERPLYPVVLFDGLRLPFADASFDLVFSSHVLEHVADLPTLLSEIRRVLSEDGVAIHVLPSATWRLWTFLTHYATLPRRFLRRTARGGAAAPGRAAPRPRFAERALAAAFERRHGARGHALDELWLYSRLAWCRLFRHAGFRIDAIDSLGLYYTGYALTGPRLSIANRRRLAAFLGSASIAYVLTPERPVHVGAYRAMTGRGT